MQGFWLTYFSPAGYPILLELTQPSVFLQTDKLQERSSPSFGVSVFKDWGRIKWSHAESTMSLPLRKQWKRERLESWGYSSDSTSHASASIMLWVWFLYQKKGLENWIICWSKEWVLETSVWHIVSTQKH